MKPHRRFPRRWIFIIGIVVLLLVLLLSIPPW